MWIQEPVSYDKHALWGISHWGCKRQQFYGFAVNRESARDVYSKHIIIAVTELQIQAESHSSFNELMATPVDFLAFLMNRLKVDTLTPELLAGLTYELMKGSCKSLLELEFFLEEVYKATTDQLDWNNPEGQQYPPHASTTDTKLPRSSRYLV
uniref:Uncharacterized protein n=1 Tax=Tanacetum cinerariifolium TaxID=118510 RepID=A0A699T6A5_TANCI|nr:hypothetical protein [Tanacetum cinerariifolium]